MPRGVLAMPHDVLHVFEQHLPKLKVSFTADLPPPADASKYSGKKGPQEEAADKAAAEAAAKQQQQQTPGGPPPDEEVSPETQEKANELQAQAVENEPPMPDKSTKEDRWKKYQEQKELALAKDKQIKTPRCDPARPVPLKGSQAEAPQFAKPKLPLCSLDAKKCNLIFDRAEGKVVSKADVDSQKAADEQESAQQGPSGAGPSMPAEPPQEEGTADEAGMYFGGDLTWPGNVIPAASAWFHLRGCIDKGVAQRRGVARSPRGRSDWGCVRRRELGLKFL